jgi:esterase/lipase
MPQKIIDKKSFRVREWLVDSPKVVFVFTAMGTKIGLYRPFAGLMNRRGYSCIVYDYPLHMLFEAKLPSWERFYADIIADAQARLKRRKDEGATDFYAYGVSMGTLIVNKFTRDTPEISHLILNLTYGDVARNIWTYKGVKKTKRSLMEQGISEEDLRRAIRYVDPIQNAAQLKGKKVLLQTARKDRVLTYDLTKHTKLAFQAAGLDLTYQENKHLGHYMSGAKNMMSIRSIDAFFSS